MGMFDSVYVPCPRCGKEHEFQSKAAPDPCLNRYTLDDAPDVVLADIGGGTVACECGLTFAIVVRVLAGVVPLTSANPGEEAPDD